MAAGDSRLLEGGVQVSRRVWIVQHAHLLEPAAGLQGGRRPAEAAVRRRSPGGVERARHLAVPGAERKDHQHGGDEEEEAEKEF